MDEVRELLPNPQCGAYSMDAYMDGGNQRSNPEMLFGGEGMLPPNNEIGSIAIEQWPNHIGSAVKIVPAFYVLWLNSRYRSR